MVSRQYKNLQRKDETGSLIDNLTYTYAGGQRILKELKGGGWQFYVMDGGQTLAVIDQSGFSHFNILTPGGQVIGRYEPSGSARRYYITDHLGSTRAVVDDGGNVLETFDYYPFGLLMPKRSSTTGNTIEKFTGKERDESIGLDYFGFRYYDPALGRWISVDPLVDAMPSWSSYAYAFNNPIYYLDPDGRCPEGYKEGDIWNGSVCGPEIVVTAKREPEEEESEGNNSFTAAAMGISGVLLADDITGVGTIDNLAIPVVLGTGLLLDALIETPAERMMSSAASPTFNDIWDSAEPTDKPHIRRKKGGMEQAEKDFDSIDDLTEVIPIPGVGKMGKTATGERIIVRNRSTDDNKPTLEKQRKDGKSKKKIRYDND